MRKAFIFFMDSAILWHPDLPLWWRRTLVIGFPILVPLSWAIAALLLVPATIELLIVSFFKAMREMWG